MRGVSQARIITVTDTRVPGVRRIVNVPQPVAGANWSVSVPAGVQWRMIGGSALFTASAAAANRILCLLYVVEGVTVFESLNGTAVAASAHENVRYCYGSPAIMSLQTASTMPIGCAGVWLEQGALIQSFTGLIDVADQWSNVNLYIEEMYVTNEQLNDIQAAREMEERQAEQYLSQEFGLPTLGT